MAIILKAATPARSDRAIVFAVDAGYLRVALFAASRLAALAPDRDFDICLCSTGGDLVVPPSLAGLGIRVCRIETEGLIASLATDGRRGEIAYLRLALPAAFAADYRRLLYLDADVFPQGGDWPALLGLDLGDRAIAAVRDNLQWRTPGRRPEVLRRLGIGAVPYLNSGLLLIDVPRFNDADILGACLRLAAKARDRLVGLDQELLNATLAGDWAELSPLWNWQYTRATMLFEALEGAHLVHFIGPRKPWAHSGGALPLKFRHAYRDFFAAHFPDAPVGPDGKAPHQNRPYLRQMLGRHLVAAGRMCDYLDRFPTDLTVH